MKQILAVLVLFLSINGFSQQRDSVATKTPECPACHTADQVIPVRYGKPTKATVDMANRGEVKLAGCMVPPERHTHYCKRDKTSFRVARLALIP